MKLYNKPVAWLIWLAAVAGLAVLSHAQSSSQSITTSGQSVTVANSGITGGVGVTAGTFDEVPVGGSPASASITVQGCMRSGTCDTAADTNTATTEQFRPVSFTKVYDYFQVTATWSGGTTTSYTINVKLGSTPASGSGSNVTITSPVDGSGYVNIDCKTGCAGGNPNGQATMANSAPVVIASNQSAVPVTAAQATASSLNATVVGTGTFATQAAQTGTWNVRNQDGAGNALTSNSTTPAAHFALDNNLTAILGTAPTTAGFLDVKGADGNVFVRQTTGSNLHVQVDTAPTTAVTQSGNWTSRTVGNTGATVDSAPAATAATNLLQVGGQFVTAPATLTTGQAGALQLTAAQNLKADLTTIAGTAPTTAGKVDVKGADGDVFVRQTTGTNLHAVLDTTSTTAVTQATGTNLHAVLDTTSTTAVTQATGTNLHAVTDATSTTAAQMTGTVPGTAPSNTEIVGSISNTAAPAPTNGQTVPLQSDTAGSLYVAFRSSSNGCASNNGSFASVAINASTTSAVQIVALSAGKKIYVCSFTVIGGGTTPTFSLVYGTGSNCATGQATLMGAIPLSTTTPFSAASPVGVTASANALCTLLAGTSPTAVGVLSYVQ